MNGTNQNQSLVKSELRYYFIRLMIYYFKRSVVLSGLRSLHSLYLAIFYIVPELSVNFCVIFPACLQEMCAQLMTIVLMVVYVYKMDNLKCVLVQLASLAEFVKFLVRICVFVCIFKLSRSFFHIFLLSFFFLLSLSFILFVHFFLFYFLCYFLLVCTYWWVCLYLLRS